MGFIDKVTRASMCARSLVCVGLDTDAAKLPAGLSGSGGVLAFNREIIRATSDLVCAYKPNSAFYEALGSEGISTLEMTCGAVPCDIPIILDVKRGDIGSTGMKYAEAAYDRFGADAVTVNPYMGFDAVKPFLRPGKCVFVLCLTSNPSSRDFQFLEVTPTCFSTPTCAEHTLGTPHTGGEPLWERIARAAVEWELEGEIGLIVGATQPDALQRIREIVGDMLLLIPGVGAQGGDLGRVIHGAGGAPGRTIVSSSREILYASPGADYAEAARARLLALRDEMNGYR